MCCGLFAVQASAATTASGTCGDNLTWVLDDAGTLTITGTGKMDDWPAAGEGIPWYVYRKSVTSIVMEKGITNIEYCSFDDFTNLESVYIPNSVTSINRSAFRGCSNLKTIIIPESVTTIGSSAFNSCVNLKSVYCLGNLTNIGSYAFGNCSNLMDVHYSGTQEQWSAISIGDGNDTLNRSNFHSSLKSGACGDNLTWVLNNVGSLIIVGIGDMDHWGSNTDVPWYKYKEDITEIILYNGITNIGFCAFSNVDNITKVRIPDSVTSISDCAFKGCQQLSTIEVSPSNLSFCDVDGVLYDINKTTLIQYPSGKTNAEYTINSNVKNIRNSAFSNCCYLQNVVIQNGLEDINYEAFRYSKSLINITIPESVTTIYPAAFDGCENLSHVYYKGNEEKWKNISIMWGNDKLANATIHFYEVVASGTCGDNLTWVLDSDGTLTISGTGEMTSSPWYDYRSNIKNVIIENGVTTIANSAFYNCSNLEDVSLPNSIETIGDISFKYCSKLTKFIVPYGTKQLGYEFLANCTSLESVFVPNTIESVGSALFENCTLSTLWVPKSFSENYDFRFWPEGASIDTEGSLQYCDTWAEMSDDTTLRIFGGEKIADYAPAKEKFSLLWDYYNYAENIVIESGITSIGADSFKNFSNCKSVLIPNTVTSIGSYAFYKFTNLSEITIPSSVTSISKYAFTYCDNLTTIYGTANSNAHTWALQNWYKFVDIQTGEEYTTIDSGEFNNGLIWAIDYTKTLTISSTKSYAPAVYFSGSCPWYKYRNDIMSIVISEGIDCIIGTPFEDCTNAENIFIPASMDDMDTDYEYFLGLKKVKNIEVAQQNKLYQSIDGNLFCKDKKTLLRYATGKTEAEYSIPDGITVVGSYSFYDCDNLNEVVFSDTVVIIESNAFYDCDILSDIVLSNSVEIIESFAVGLCPSITDIEITEKVTSIGRMAFAGCDNLITVTIPKSVINIESAAFSLNDKLESITVALDNEKYCSIDGNLFSEDKTELIQYCIGKTDSEYVVPNTVKILDEYSFSYSKNLTKLTIPKSVTNIKKNAFSVSGYLKDVYYEGTDEEWDLIEIESNNTSLHDATFYCKYKITYDSNGGSTISEYSEISSGESILIISDSPQKEGYTFLGWSSNKTSTTAEYFSGSEIIPSSSLVLYAVWKIEEFSIVYDANGGSNAPLSQTKTYGIDLILSKDTPSKEGYTFKGWSTDKSDVVAEYQPNSVYTLNTATTLYAIWEIKTYTISYDANGGAPTPEPQEVIHGKTIKLSNVIPTKEGYDFIGWSLNNLNCSPGSELYTNSSVTLYAVWQIKTYTVTYDANGGTNAPANQTKTYGVDLSLSNAMPAREGYTFKGWSTVKDAVAEYQPNSVYSENAELTLYAVWEINTYVITYNSNGGNNAPESQKKTHNINLELSTVEPTKTGHIFKGWAISNSSSNVEYYSGDIYEENGDVILYAVWEKEKYTITYNANGGTNAPNSQLQIYEEPLKITNEQPVKDGYTFMGWTYTSSSTVVRYQSGSTYEENRSRTLYAVWKANEYIVEYDANGGSNAPESQTKVHNVDLTLSDSIPSREGYTFVGWSSNPNATSVEYNAAGIYQSNVDVTLYAVWKINTYTISYDVGNGNNAPEAQLKTYGNNLTLSSSKPTREGHTFMGWSTTEIGTIAEYQPNSIFTINADTVLYAVWEINTYTMVYDANGGIGAPESQEKTYGIDLTLSSVMPSKEGYTFKGWAATKGGTVEYQPSSIYSANTNVTLYAVWEINTYSIIYDANGGIGAPDSQKKEYGNDFVITSSVPTREGYAFKGWALSPDSTVVSYIAGSIYSDNKGITLYAVWAKQLTAPTFKVTSFVGGKTIVVTAEQGTIYYTLDGSEPSKNSSIYTGEINLTETAVLKAVVMQENCESSPVIEQTIVVDKTGTPELNWDSNSIVEIGTIVKLNNTFDAVYYSVNGNEFVQYTNGITLTDDCTIKLYAINSGSSKSEIVEYAFTIAQSEKPVITITDVYGGKEIYLSANEKDTIYYTLDGSVPDKNSNKYTGKFTVSEEAAITVVALRDTAKISESTTENIVVEKSISPTFSINTDSVMEDTECELYAEGYVIYYTTDGSDPLISGKVYETPIVLKESVQIKAIAVKLGSAYSDISTKNITVTKLPSITLELIEDNGDTVKIAAEISENPGISSALLKLKYPKAALSYIDIEKGTMLNNGICNVHETNDGLNILWINANNSYENGKLFAVNLSRNDDYVADVPISVTYSAGDIINDNFDDVNPKLNNASITLSNNTYKYGISTLEKDVVYSSTKVDGKVTLNVQSSEGNKTVDLIVAIYDENGKLLNITSNDITLALGDNKAIVDVSATVPETCNSVTVKFLLWESVNNIRPLCGFEEMTISK